MENKKISETHDWQMGWENSDKPHPGFGGSYNIYGGYVTQCKNCGMYIYEFEDEKSQYYHKACVGEIREF